MQRVKLLLASSLGLVTVACGSASHGEDKIAKAIEQKYDIGVKHCKLARGRAPVDLPHPKHSRRWYCVLDRPRINPPLFGEGTSTAWCALGAIDDPKNVELQFPASITTPPSC